MHHYKRSSVWSALVLGCGLFIAASAQADTTGGESSGPSHAAKGVSAPRALIAADVVALHSQASAGQANAQYAVGMLHAERRDTAGALYWFQKAALQGHVPAEYSYRAITTAENHAELGW